MRVIREDKVWALFHASDPNKKENYMCELFMLFSFENLRDPRAVVKKILDKFGEP